MTDLLPPLWATCHAVTSDERVVKATAAIHGMYLDWQENGGCSPDTRDESRAVALALGLPHCLEHGSPALEVIWSASTYGVDVEVLALMHVCALIPS